MNKVASKKSVPRQSKRVAQKGQKRKYEKSSSVSGKKPKRMKRIQQKKRKSSRHLNEYSEYESSRLDIRRPHHQLTRMPSDNSVIYVKTFPPRDHIPVIDLTKSSHSILYTTVSSKSFPSNTSLKVIYKSNNFGNRLQKHLTSSLLTIPLKRKIEKSPGAKSTSNLAGCSKEKLSILDIPPEYFDEDTDGSEYAFHDMSKADLNEEDKCMIDCIVMREDESESTYNLGVKQPIENMCKMYGVNPDDNFD